MVLPSRSNDISKTTCVITSVMLVLMAAGAAAQRQTKVTLESAALEAVSWHPSVTQAAGMLNARSEDINVARAAYGPQITAGAGAGYDSRIGDSWRPRPQFGASQTLFDFGKTKSDVEAARAGTRAGHAEMLLTIDTLLRDTSYAVVEMQRAAVLRTVAVAQQARIGEITRMVRARYELGAATKSDALQAQARLEAAQATLTQIDASLRRWGSNLAFLLGRDAPPADVSAEVPAWLDRSCNRGPRTSGEAPAVMVADALKDRAAADLRRSRADRMPTISLAGDASPDITRPFGNRGIYNFGIRISTSVFNGGAARARERGAGYALNAAEAAAEQARTESGLRLSEAQEQIGGLRQLLTTLASRERNMEQTGKLYRLQYLDMGTRTLVDLLNAEQELHQVRFDEVNTVHDLRRLQLECLYYSGHARQAFGLSGKVMRGITL